MVSLLRHFVIHDYDFVKVALPVTFATLQLMQVHGSSHGRGDGQPILILRLAQQLHLGLEPLHAECLLGKIAGSLI